LPGNKGRNRPWIIIANVRAGSGGRAIRKIEAVLRRARVRFHCVVTRSVDEGAQLARSISGKAVVAAVLGGDGTMNNIGSHLAGGKAWLAALPGGTENLLCRQLGLPSDPADAAAQLLDARPVRWDLGVLGARPFLMIAGVGFDGAVCAETGGLAKSMFKQAAYAMTAMRMLLRPAKVFSVRWEGKKMGRTVQACFSNGAYYGGGFKVAPKADPADGVLDMTIFPYIGRLSRGMQMASAMLLHREHLPHFSRHRILSALVGGRGLLQAQVDGEPFSVANPIVSIRPGALTLLSPQIKR